LDFFRRSSSSAGRLLWTRSPKAPGWMRPHSDSGAPDGSPVTRSLLSEVSTRLAF
jgi:hypothetical protein